ncbi:helix-turn-helix domain-containing protein [Shewanella pneumatophori]|uniref:Helix-turn-helix domain-containing protein n=2 Tax=Shewanella pneumatophori TaxID=314092 RepID=A0A9X1ZCT6_9GAMM|nr:helix-turn-helix domain-containing protein [Shewanella pneumatophori]MCL1138672.1 helix-turn-helix domain-containing protein [Shewanella pneumatophori]
MLPFAGFLDKLRFSADEEDYSKQQYCSWQIIAPTPCHQQSSNGVSIEVTSTIADIELTDFDYLVVFGGRSARSCQQLPQQYHHILHAVAAKGVTLVSIDNGCFLLAEAGLLKQHKVAVHWRHVQEFRAAYPSIEVASEQLFCIDNKRISCAGGNAAIDLAVELLARHCGRTKALKGLADMLVDEAREQRHQLKSLNANIQINNTASRHVGRAISLMRQQLASTDTIDVLALKLAISRRQLDRLFKDNFSQTAREYWAEMRLQHIHWRLINSDHSLQHLADEVAISDVSYLCKVFRKRFGTSPHALRRSKLIARANSN